MRKKKKAKRRATVSSDGAAKNASLLCARQTESGHVSCKVKGLVCVKEGGKKSVGVGVREDECWGRGNRFGKGQPAESQWEVAGVSWRCGGGHMEGRLALWLPPERTPAGRGRHCQEEGREQNKEGRRVFRNAYEFQASGNGL